MEGLRTRPRRKIRSGRARSQSGQESPRSPKSKETTQAEANGDARKERRHN